jgi:small subunit ribosomal protein S20
MAQGTPRKVKKRKKSVLKRIRQTQLRTLVNRAKRTAVRTALKKLREALAAGDANTAEKLLSPTLSAIDRAIRKGVLHRNAASRYKSRLMLAYNALRGAQTA